jgi:hypothetical protein
MGANRSFPSQQTQWDGYVQEVPPQQPQGWSSEDWQHWQRWQVGKVSHVWSTSSLYENISGEVEARAFMMRATISAYDITTH